MYAYSVLFSIIRSKIGSQKLMNQSRYLVSLLGIRNNNFFTFFLRFRMHIRLHIPTLNIPIVASCKCS